MINLVSNKDLKLTLLILKTGGKVDWKTISQIAKKLLAKQ